MLQFNILTIFPDIIQGALSLGIMGRACDKGVIAVIGNDLRDYTQDKHRRVDDTPYGGGPGMVLSAEPIVRGIEALHRPELNSRTILLSPRGTVFTQAKARELADLDQLILVCGRYEGVDERVLSVVDEELSVGDYILSGGEFAALSVIDAVARLVPGVLGDPLSLEQESLNDKLLEYPQYTRPSEFRGMKVPDVLLSGNHRQIEAWRREQAEALTAKRRPDLLGRGDKET